MNLANAQPIPNLLEEQADFAVPPALLTAIDELITHYPQKRSASLMLLHLFQERFGFVSRQAVEWIAEKLQLTPINVYELVTFYPMFTRQKVGNWHVRVCRTLSCALAGSHKVHQHLCEKLGLDPHGHGPQTTPDGQFTVEFVECLAGCDAAPILLVNDKFHERVDEAKADQILGSAAK